MNGIHNEATNGVDYEVGSIAAPAPDLDPELHFEERLGKAIAENDNLEREKTDLRHQLEDLEGRFNRLQDSNVRRF